MGVEKPTMSGDSGSDRIRTISILAAVFLSAGASFGKYSGGTGEPNDPYRIATAEDLNDIGNHIEDFNKCFVCVNDINLAAYTGTQFKTIGNIVTKFTGVFDGNGHVVSNLTITASARDYVGLFGYLGSGAEIKYIGVVDANIRGHNSVGGLVGENYGSVTSCYSTGAVTGTDAVGGLAGVNDGGSMTSCYATGSVSGYYYVGGLVGRNCPGGRLTSCYATGAASGGSYVGGLVGQNFYGSVTSCYANGAVSGDTYVGGLVGSNSGSITSSFWDTETSGQTTSAGGTGKTTAEMQKESTFTDAGWDFVEVWDIGENQTYPFLRVHSAGDINHDDKVDWFDFAILAGHWLEGAGG